MILPLVQISPTIPFLLGLGMTFSALGSKLSMYCALYLDPYFISVHYQASCPSNTKLFQFLVHTKLSSFCPSLCPSPLLLTPAWPSFSPQDRVSAHDRWHAALPSAASHTSSMPPLTPQKHLQQKDVAKTCLFNTRFGSRLSQSPTSLPVH